MKITPDASLFQALSSFPRVNRDAINPTANQGNQGQAFSAQISPDAQQQSTQINRQRQAAPARAQQSNSSSASGQLSQNGNRAANPYAREAPGVDQRPAFKRLGQIIDISV